MRPAKGSAGALLAIPIAAMIMSLVDIWQLRYEVVEEVTVVNENPNEEESK